MRRDFKPMAAGLIGWRLLPVCIILWRQVECSPDLPEPSSQRAEGGLGPVAQVGAFIITIAVLCIFLKALCKWRVFFRDRSLDGFEEIGAGIIDHCDEDEDEELLQRSAAPSDVEDGEGGTTSRGIRALQEFYDNVKEKASRHDFGLENWSSSMTSASTSATRRSSGGDEDDALLGSDEETYNSTCVRPRNDRSRIDEGDDEDIEAMQALLKLRPSAQDSVGDDEDEDSMSRPLIGTERQTTLTR